MVAVDPWTHGVGDGGVLSFPNAVAAVVQRLNGYNGAALGIAVSASSMADFVGQLSGLNAAFPLPSLGRLARRAGQMATLDVTRMVLAPHQAHGGGVPVNALPAIRALQRADLIKAASDEAVAFAGSSSSANVAAFTAAKAAHDSFVAGVQAAAGAGLTGGSGFRFYAASNIASALLVGHPGHEFSLTAIHLFLGSTADLALMTEVFA